MIAISAARFRFSASRLPPAAGADAGARFTFFALGTLVGMADSTHQPGCWGQNGRGRDEVGLAWGMRPELPAENGPKTQPALCSPVGGKIAHRGTVIGGVGDGVRQLERILGDSTQDKPVIAGEGGGQRCCGVGRLRMWLRG